MDKVSVKKIEKAEWLTTPGIQGLFREMVAEARMVRAANPLVLRKYWEDELAKLPGLVHSAFITTLRRYDWDVDRVLQAPSDEIGVIRGMGLEKATIVFKLASYVNYAESKDPVVELVRKLEALPKEEKARQASAFLRSLER
jgi:hypothetical protein